MKEKQKLLSKFSWDGVESEEELLIRAMLFGNPEEVVKIYDLETLKRVFLNNIHRFARENKTFWQLILEFDDAEVESAAKNCFRESAKMYPFG